jgi:hypothetical protein
LTASNTAAYPEDSRLAVNEALGVLDQTTNHGTTVARYETAL